MNFTESNTKKWVEEYVSKYGHDIDPFELCKRVQKAFGLKDPCYEERSAFNVEYNLQELIDLAKKHFPYVSSLDEIEIEVSVDKDIPCSCCSISDYTICLTLTGPHKHEKFIARIVANTIEISKGNK